MVGNQYFEAGFEGKPSAVQVPVGNINRKCGGKPVYYRGSYDGVGGQVLLMFAFLLCVSRVFIA